MTNNTKTCSGCQSEILETNRFCNRCGAAQNQQEVNVLSSKWLELKQVALFFVAQVAICLLPLATDEQSISSHLLLDTLSAIVTLIFFGYNWHQNAEVLKWKNFSSLKLIGYAVLSVLSSVLVQYIVGHLNAYVFHKEISLYEDFSYHRYGKYLLVLSFAVFPALFEELAFRGFVMQRLLNALDEKQAVYISSFLFFIVHFSFVSVFWLLPFAILLGFVRIREKTLWYGVAIHFCFNLTACLVELYNVFG